jgi:hypothetical protein
MMRQTTATTVVTDKNTVRSFDDFDREAERCGQAIITLNSMRVTKKGKKMKKVRIDNFLRD